MTRHRRAELMDNSTWPSTLVRPPGAASTTPGLAPGVLFCAMLRELPADTVPITVADSRPRRSLRRCCIECESTSGAEGSGGGATPEARMNHDTLNDLMARMLTCATHLTTIEVSEILRDDQMEAIIDAKSLLAQAAATLQQLLPPPAPESLGEPMAILEPPAPRQDGFSDPGVQRERYQQALNPRACPRCDSRAAKRVDRQ